MLVIADRGFPFWPTIETVDLALVDDVPTMLQVLRAIRSNFVIGQAFMAEKFRRANTPPTQADFAAALNNLPLARESHDDFKKRVPAAVGLVRTGDTIPYANMILVSA